MSAYGYERDWEEPDGTCESCGIDLADDPGGDHDDHHRQCWACWRGEDDDVELDEQLDRVDRVSPLTEVCPGCGERRILYPSPGGRECADCKAAHR